MLQSTMVSAANTPSNSRVFVYEVVGLRQNDNTDRNSYSIRESGSTFIKVSYKNMNQTMRRIAANGGHIVSIRPVEAAE
jgi:sulfite reductase alpha subunit-like flavoprotein